MSYILDALKRADAERERGAVPGLHSQTAAPATAAKPAPSNRRWPLPTAIGLGVLLLLATALRWFNQPAAPAAALVPAPTAVLTAPASAPASPVIAPAATAAMAPPTAAAGHAPVAPILRPEPPAATVAPAQDTTAGATTTVGSGRPAVPKAQAAEASDAGVRRFADLSPEQRAQLPQLNVNGASYSANPAHRMLIVNGAVVHEGQELAPGLILERIGLHQAVIRQGSLRLSISY